MSSISQKNNPISPRVATVQSYKTAFMQRIADHVRLGYNHWTSGTITAERAPALARKFHQRYGICLTRHQKAYGRSKGEASAVLIMREAEPGQLQWMLMLTPGENLAHDLEKLKDATTAAGRIVVTGYELVQLPRRGSERAAWTWRMPADTYEAWRERILRSARRHPDSLTRELAELARTPGFSGCRGQVRKLLQLARAEARRRLGSAATTVSHPTRIGYVQRLSQSGTPLSVWIRQQRAAASSDVTTQL
jgi:uncharacterized protein with PIN domain